MVYVLYESQKHRLAEQGKKETPCTTGCDLFKGDAAVQCGGSVLLLILSEVAGSHHERAAAGHILPLCFGFVVL